MRRHSGARRACVSVTLDDRDARLVVADDGQGFDRASRAVAGGLAAREGFGLLGMRERAALAGGHAEVDSRPGAEEPTVTVTVPVKAAPVAAAPSAPGPVPAAVERVLGVTQRPCGGAAVPPAVIRVLVADDQELIREGIASLLGIQPGMAVVGTARDGATAAELAAALAADVVLMDVRMPGGDGTQATALIRRELPACQVVMLTTFDDEEYVVQALRAGAAGYLLKDLPADELAAQSGWLTPALPSSARRPSADWPRQSPVRTGQPRSGQSRRSQSRAGLGNRRARRDSSRPGAGAARPADRPGGRRPAPGCVRRDEPGDRVAPVPVRRDSEEPHLPHPDPAGPA